MLIFAAGCSALPTFSSTPPSAVASATAVSAAPTSLPPTPTPTPEPPRLLAVCMGGEPRSLFPLSDTSVAARTVRQAIYDGPFDTLSYQLQPVILEALPTLANGAARLQPLEVLAGEWVIDADGELRVLAAGVRYLPTGCRTPGCAVEYSGAGPVSIEQLVLNFRLRPGLQWSDGAPLTADDSLFSYELARALYPAVRADLVDRTAAYSVLDELTLEWRGIPGERSAIDAMSFFSPLPRHLYGATPPQDLLAQEAPARQPLGWGAYRVDEWTVGDHITLSRNPSYFRAAEGLPFFDFLVFRFYADGQAALQALLAGECDYVDESAGLERLDLAELRSLESAGRLRLFTETGSAWEQLTFNLAPLDPALPPIFAQRAVRQAVAQCVDRPAIAQALGLGEQPLLVSYLAPDHPLVNPEAAAYPYDPQAAAAALTAAGWLDQDADPATPRQSLGVSGVVDGTPLRFTYRAAQDPTSQAAAQLVVASLSGCGVQAELLVQPAAELFAPGPEGPLFGRRFEAAQFAWNTALEPACFLYTTAEIPGAYPEYPRGWGGANPGAYSRPEFDQACAMTRINLPEDPSYQAGHALAQALFAEDLPALPLFLRLKVVAGRPDICGVQVDPSAEGAVSNLEGINYGTGCGP